MSLRPTRIVLREPPRRALVLAAGFGSRLDPLTRIVPKALLPVWSEPLLGRTLRMLADWGVRDVAVNLHHGAAIVAREAPRLAPAGMRMSFSFEPEILGTGGALRAATWFVATGGSCWILNADVLCDLDPRSLIRGLDADPRALSNLWMVPDAGPRTVLLRGGRVRAFRAPVPGAPGTCTFAGVQLVRPDAVRHAPESGFGTLVELYEAAMCAGRHVLGTVVPGSRWADIGTPAQWLAAHDAWNPHPGRSGRAWRVARSPGAVCAPGACAERCVLLPGSRLERGAQARNAILAPGVVVRRAGEGLIVPAACALTPSERRVLDRLDPKGGERPWMAQLLPPRGSGRAFLRLEGATRSMILVRDGGARPENRRLAGHTRFLRRLRLPVPRLLAESEPDRFALYEDAGMRSLEGVARAGEWPVVLPLYARVIEIMARWHIEGARAARRTRLSLEPPMRGPVFDYERQLFLREFFDPRLGGRRALRVGVESELRRVGARLRRDAQVLIHRDLQSSNILCPPSATGEGAMPCEVRLIDFQGMRIGPAMYDLASLLMDPYVEPPAEVRARMLEAYVRRACGAARPELFGWAAVQRLTQALGAFARLGRGADGERFARHIPAGLRMLDAALDLTGESLPCLREVVRRLRDARGI